MFCSAGMLGIQAAPNGFRLYEIPFSYNNRVPRQRAPGLFPFPRLSSRRSIQLHAVFFFQVFQADFVLF